MDYQDQTDFLQEEENELGYVDPADRWLRLGNYLIDQTVLVVLFNIIIVIWTTIAAASGGVTPEKFFLSDDVLVVLGRRILVSVIITVLYYAVSETVMNGRTIGKLATNTIAITQDGAPFTFKHALLRSLVRAIPFEALSAFGYLPWHDSLSKTVVVRKTWDNKRQYL
ncbi:hypothetical protein A4H97_00315 [Niastella yeongjuensis]|uniref:RDD domain-containing protein n=1 Tax=Niastella yeongjuensis TaxID=354355 RepID=A0A1V9EW15_9BACT|nr:RDD family protein [Niastella yeongjuensis]OQP50326.1 hypothetical protein A4H97_00315 [Niastella yeongjuensis]SEN39483.1 Uncharacterized membrane protein YckC, RDD family [Niastella yeongjuensis]